MNYELEKLAGSLLKQASSEKLQILAKRAASDFVGKSSSSLNDSIKNVIQNEGLNKNQIQRVSEMANQATWKAQFHESGSTDEFTPADASSIVEELSSRPVSIPERSLDYYQDPGERHQEGFDLDQVFQIDDSGHQLEQLNPGVELQQEQEKVASVRDTAEYALNTLMGGMQDTAIEFYGFVKQAFMMDGIGILQMAKAIGDVTDSEKFASSIMKTASDKLRKEGVRIDLNREQALVKVPVVVNSEHPLLETAVRFEKLASSYRMAYQEFVQSDAKNKELLRQLRTV